MLVLIAALLANIVIHYLGRAEHSYTRPQHWTIPEAVRDFCPAQDTIRIGVVATESSSKESILPVKAGRATSGPHPNRTALRNICTRLYSFNAGSYVVTY